MSIITAFLEKPGIVKIQKNINYSLTELWNPVRAWKIIQKQIHGFYGDPVIKFTNEQLIIKFKSH